MNKAQQASVELRAMDELAALIRHAAAESQAYFAAK